MNDALYRLRWWLARRIAPVQIIPRGNHFDVYAGATYRVDFLMCDVDGQTDSQTFSMTVEDA